jgi:glycosyltransferase involved in cell wall biosynthesis
MKIVQVVPYFPPHVGGMEFYVARLCRELVARGHGVVVFTSSDRRFSYHEKVGGVEIYRLRRLTKVYNVPIAPSLFSSMLLEDKPDIIHAHQYPVFFSDVSAIISSMRHVPLLLHVHVIAEPESAISGLVSNLYYTTIGRLPFNAAHTIVTPSFAYRKMLTHMRIESKKLKVIPYSVDLARFHPSNSGEAFKKRYNCDGSSVVLSVGRLNYQKGFSYLLKAMSMMVQKLPDLKLVIVGNGEQFSFLKELSQSLGLGSSVIFTGPLPQAELTEAYAAADVFVLPSIFESFGIALIEAQASGKPVVCTRVGGAPETLSEMKSGLIVDPKEPSQLAEAIITILHDPKLAKSMGDEGRRFVENRFDWRKNVDLVVEVYEKMQMETSYD